MEKPVTRKKKNQAPKEEAGVQKATVKGEKTPKGKKPTKKPRKPRRPRKEPVLSPEDEAHIFDAFDASFKMTLRVSPCLFLFRGRSPMSAVSVDGSLNTRQTTFATREFTLERSPLSVTSVGRPSGTAQMSPNIKEFTPARSPLSVGSVGKPSTVAPTF